MIKTLAFRLGARHRHYMNEGNDNSYWAPFAQQLPITIIHTYLHTINNDNRIRRILRIRPRAEKSEEEELTDSWRQFMNMVVESMKRGYEGCPSEKTPLRLSITKFVIAYTPTYHTSSNIIYILTAVLYLWLLYVLLVVDQHHSFWNLTYHLR
uniref:Transmembrane protein n=1 Tax=Heterorhabditis bacteriophora TaxID=37862 RepID=A0A1I7WVU3_HETBA